MTEYDVKILSVIPMRTQVVFPNTTVGFDIGRGLSLAAVERAQYNDSYVFLTRQSVEKELPEADDLSLVGTVAVIRQKIRMPGDKLRVVVEGVYRARSRGFRFEGPYLYTVAEPLMTVHGDATLEEAHLRTARSMVNAVMASDPKLARDLEGPLSHAADGDTYINVASHFLHFRDEQKQELLEEPDLVRRFLRFEELVSGEREIADLEKKIASDVRKSIDKSQKEYYLREQIKAIHTELGEDEQEMDGLRDRILKKGLPPAVEKKALSELSRMDRMQPSSPEYTVLRNYTDWILDLPWKEETADTVSLSEVERILDEDHYGLEKIKERVLEYLAVLKLTGSLKAPILCLVGPPGVGKTSIARSVARALGRKFVRMSLGGLKDEAEIRGHRRTYIGSMPGRILYEMKNAGTINPVFLLDEVDKISSDLRGDPADALLEVLDPEQNSTFRDRYLEVEYDLSKVMFIATANTLDGIPMPLRDRMEIIELSGYTPQEKAEIAKRYLIPKKRKENGLADDAVTFTDDAVFALIEGYTMEAGVRSLERTVGSVCRKIAVRTAKEEGQAPVTVTADDLETYLGARRYKEGDGMLPRDEVGMATGLAWTAVGGTTLTVEVTAMQGRGDVLLTGQLGDVMKESARAAISFIRSHAVEYGIDAEDFEKKDLHIHVPEGATPKDGPSAGITMATAILSAFTGRPVRRDIAMTGEITLRGKVLPIGGLKEKALAASRIGIRDIIIPEENRKDVEEIPDEVRSNLNFICVNEVGEVFANAMAETGYAN